MSFIKFQRCWCRSNVEGGPIGDGTIFDVSGLNLAVHTAADPTAILPAMRDLVRSIGPTLPLYGVSQRRREIGVVYGVEGRDPTVFAAVVAVLMAVALLANSVPAHHPTSSTEAPRLAAVAHGLVERLEALQRVGVPLGAGARREGRREAAEVVPSCGTAAERP